MRCRRKWGRMMTSIQYEERKREEIRFLSHSSLSLSLSARHYACMCVLWGRAREFVSISSHSKRSVRKMWNIKTFCNAHECLALPRESEILFPAKNDMTHTLFLFFTKIFFGGFICATQWDVMWFGALLLFKYDDGTQMGVWMLVKDTNQQHVRHIIIFQHNKLVMDFHHGLQHRCTK